MDDLAHFPPGTQTYVGCLVSGLRVRWYERGPEREDAPTVLCLHGFPELAVSWHEQLAALGDDYRVVAPDMRGYGGTDAPSRVRDYTLDILARDTVELIDALGVDKVHLVGHDWGGAVAWEVAQRYGARLHSLSVLNCPPLQIMVKELRRLEQVRRSWYVFFFQLPWLPERRMRGNPELITEVMRNNAYNREPFTHERLEPYIRQVRERGLPGINYYRAALRHLLRRLVPIHVPTRLIWGLRDHALGPWFADPTHYESWVDPFDRVLLEDAGHFPAQEAAKEVNAALREHFERATGEGLS
ncbi:Fluoroacetate dehalogenase [Enhygromyxa salina]|uniref:Fluoroacetate dehalogenase n=1 Tax=Enhygromyxa salina TaxID=215803 RepID=A0A2S9YAK5_9BACT|nr:alpha/beta fold hydrolase [Enhygromyxa salina]PRQ02148.1 Fluoroacetate dehalogenase [Enhygromyxa salina]